VSEGKAVLFLANYQKVGDSFLNATQTWGELEGKMTKSTLGEGRNETRYQNTTWGKGQTFFREGKLRVPSAGAQWLCFILAGGEEDFRPSARRRKWHVKSGERPLIWGKRWGKGSNVVLKCRGGGDEIQSKTQILHGKRT